MLRVMRVRSYTPLFALEARLELLGTINAPHARHRLGR